MKYVQCKIGRLDGRNFPAIMAEDTYHTILDGLGVDLDASFDSQEEFEAQGWDYGVSYRVEADSLQEAVEKIEAAKRRADEAQKASKNPPFVLA